MVISQFVIFSLGLIGVGAIFTWLLNKKLQMNQLEKLVFSNALGCIALISYSFLLGFFGALGNKNSLYFQIPIGFGLMAFIPFSFQWLRNVNWKNSNLWFAAILFLPVLILSFPQTFYLESPTDVTYYHLLAPKIWWHEGGFHFNGTNPLIYQTGYWQGLYFFPFALINPMGQAGLQEVYLFSNFIHYIHGFFFSTLTLTLLWQRFLPHPLLSYAVSLFSLLKYELFYTARLAQSDYAVLLFLILGIYLLLKMNSAGTLAIFLSALFFSFSFGSKFSVAFFIVPFSIMFCAFFKPGLKASLLFVGTGFFASIPLLLRNFIHVGNPTFPAMDSIWQSSFMSDLWGMAQALTEKGDLETPLWGYPIIFGQSFKQNPTLFLVLISVIYFIRKKNFFGLSISIGSLGSLMMATIMMTERSISFHGVRISIFAYLFANFLILYLLREFLTQLNISKLKKVLNSKQIQRVLLSITILLMIFQGTLSVVNSSQAWSSYAKGKYIPPITCEKRVHERLTEYPKSKFLHFNFIDMYILPYPQSESVIVSTKISNIVMNEKDKSKIIAAMKDEGFTHLAFGLHPTFPFRVFQNNQIFIAKFAESAFLDKLTYDEKDCLLVKLEDFEKAVEKYHGNRN